MASTLRPDLRADMKVRRKTQAEFIRSHPDLEVRDLASLMQAKGIFAKGTWFGGICARIATIRREEQLIKEGKIKFGPDPLAERLSAIAKSEPVLAEPEAGEIRASKLLALRAMGSYLKISGWRRLPHSSAARQVWRDPHTGAEHRIDMAFVVAITREAEIRRLAKSPRSRWRRI